MASNRVVLLGASAGGFIALQQIATHLRRDFPAPLLVVLHIGSHDSSLPELLSQRGPLRATFGVDGEEVEPGRIYVAPPNRHMLLQGQSIEIFDGPKENHTRPAIDPLFVSAALSRGPEAIGVVLTGRLDDGTAGLAAIKRCGGIAVVQDPNDAQSPSMPTSALRHVEIDHKTTLDELPALLATLAAEPARAARIAVPENLVHEQDMILDRGDAMEHLRALGRASTFACPECHGSLWEIADSKPTRYRCHTGHGFSLRNLVHAQDESTDSALWSAVRALQEKRFLLEGLAEDRREEGDHAQAEALSRQAGEVAEHAAVLRHLVEQPLPQG